MSKAVEVGALQKALRGWGRDATELLGRHRERKRDYVRLNRAFACCVRVEDAEAAARPHVQGAPGHDIGEVRAAKALAVREMSVKNIPLHMKFTRGIEVEGYVHRVEYDDDLMPESLIQ